MIAKTQGNMKLLCTESKLLSLLIPLFLLLLLLFLLLLLPLLLFLLLLLLLLLLLYISCFIIYRQWNLQSSIMVVMIFKGFTQKMKEVLVLQGQMIFFYDCHAEQKYINFLFVSSHWEKRTLHHELMNGYISA